MKPTTTKLFLFFNGEASLVVLLLPLSQSLVEDQSHRDGEVEAPNHPLHGDGDVLVGPSENLFRDSQLLVSENDGPFAAVIHGRHWHAVVGKRGRVDLKTLPGQLFHASLDAEKRVEGEPSVGPGGDGLVDGKGFVHGVDDVEVLNAEEVHGSQDGVGVMGVAEVFENYYKVGLPLGENAFDSLNSFFGGHLVGGEKYAEGGTRTPTGLLPLDPEPSASASFATSASQKR